MVVSRWPRQTFIPVVYRFFNANLIIFFFFLLIDSDPVRAHVGRVFYVWLSVFNVFVVAVFWGFMADFFVAAQAKRVFGMIAVGGTLGAIVGSALTVKLAPAWGAVNLMIISMVLLEVAVFCVGRLNKAPVQTIELQHSAQETIGGTFWTGVQKVFRSPYLLGICFYVLLQSLTSTFAYFEQARIIKENVFDSDSRTALFATINLWVNLLTLPIQLFLTGRVIYLLGVGITLTLLPLFTCVGFGLLGFMPTLVVLVVFQVSRRACNYALSKPSREVLFTVVTREENNQVCIKKTIDNWNKRLARPT